MPQNKFAKNSTLEKVLTSHLWVIKNHTISLENSNETICCVILNSKGVEIFREKGRCYIIEQFNTFLKQKKFSPHAPQNWYFSCEDENIEYSNDYFNRRLEPFWISQKECNDTFVLHGKVPLDLYYFRGHFPHFPLVPGVIQLQWISDKLDAFSINKKILRIDNLKFQKFLRPTDNIELTLKWDKIKNRIRFQMKSNDDICGSGLIVFHNE